MFVLPDNTAGTAPLKMRRTLSPPAIQAPITQISERMSAVHPGLARTTLYYHLKVEKRQSEGSIVRRNTRRREGGYTCSKCGREREKPQHTQYYGRWYCGITATEYLEAWREKCKLEREEKKKNKE